MEDFHLNSSPLRGETSRQAIRLWGSLQIPCVMKLKGFKATYFCKILQSISGKTETSEIALKAQKPAKAVGILENTNSYFRCWYWNRLKFLAGNTETQEILWLNPHPEIGVAKARLLG